MQIYNFYFAYIYAAIAADLTTAGLFVGGVGAGLYFGLKRICRK